MRRVNAAPVAVSRGRSVHAHYTPYDAGAGGADNVMMMYHEDAAEADAYVYAEADAEVDDLGDAPSSVTALAAKQKNKNGMMGADVSKGDVFNGDGSSGSVCDGECSEDNAAVVQHTPSRSVATGLFLTLGSVPGGLKQLLR